MHRKLLEIIKLYQHDGGLTRSEQWRTEKTKDSQILFTNVAAHKTKIMPCVVYVAKATSNLD